jgi:hypothetical protein
VFIAQEISDSESGFQAAIKAAEQHNDSPFDFEGLASLILEDHRLEPSFSSRLSFHCLLSELTFLSCSFFFSRVRCRFC